MQVAHAQLNTYGSFSDADYKTGTARSSVWRQNKQHIAQNFAAIYKHVNMSVVCK